MRITQQLLRSRAAAPLQVVEFLDLSNLGIVSIEKLNSCPKLQALNLRGNSIVEASNLDLIRNLWRLDLSNNEICDLDCLAKFVTMGTLNLANNNIGWQEVGKLRHMHILELSLHGNKQLEKDPYYRIHLIDCLPYVWMLDGRMITSAERLQVKHFFADSALTDHPIRRKLSKEWFVPSSLKRIDVTGVYGEKATHMMIRFPANGPSNIDSDRRRLKYLAQNAEEDLVLEKKYSKRDFQVLKYRRTFIQDILDARASDRERCNMLMLLLVATLEFVMPTHLVKETLEVAKLSKVGKLYTMDLFLLPKDIRCRIVCILLGAIKIDKDLKEDGGLYDKLYLCLFYTVAELSKLSNSIPGRNNAPKMKISQLYRDYKCLLASEIVQLLCIVPAFFEYIDRDVGVMNLLVTATGDTMITDKVAKLTSNIHKAGGDTKKLYEELSDFLLQKVQELSLNLNNKTHNLTHEDQLINNTKSKPMKSTRSPLDAADYHMKGISSPNLDPPSVLSARRQSERERKHFPRLGDYLLLGPQTLGKVIGLPQPFVAHVAMDSIPVANGAMESKLRESEDHYTYVNMDQLDFDIDLGFWKPKGSIGDSMLREFLAFSNGASSKLRTSPFIQPLTKGLLFSSTVPFMDPKHYIFHCKWFTIHTIEDLRKELNRRANLVGDQMPRPNSPEESLRPYSASPRPGGRDTATPLLFSPGMQSVLEENGHRRNNLSQVEYTPRPMTSVLKEKLDLKLDFSARRVQSAGPSEHLSLTTSSPRNTPEPPVTDEVIESKPDCVHCAMAVAQQLTDQHTDHQHLTDHTHQNGHQQHQTEQEQQQQHQQQQNQGDNNQANVESSPMTQTHAEDAQGQPDAHQTPEGEPIHPSNEGESNKENEQPADNTNTSKSPKDVDQVNGEVHHSPTVPHESSQTVDEGLAHSDEEPELQGLVTSRTERPASAPGVKVVTPGVKLDLSGVPIRKSNSSLRINIPQMDLHDEDESSARKGRPPPRMRGRQVFTTSRAPLKTGKLSMQNKNRPYSAMDAYRYIMEHPRKPIGSSENLFNTSYQEQRTEAWRQSAATTASSNAHTPRQGTPPPQRPSSPDHKTRPSSGMAVTRANDWMAGGRDLYWESIQKRPRSGHIPGWKEGLPDNMRRPKSAVAARTLNRQTRRSHPVTPSSLAHEAMMQGGRFNSPRWPLELPTMLELSDYAPMHQQMGLPRRLGSAGAPVDQPVQDLVYRIPPSSCERSPRSQSTISGAHQNMTSIFEDDEFNVVNTEYTFPFGL
ncbi:uncharacterized protein LOC128214034 isoform X3 [Mya arenaria]|uniref:uncharacterized protein LOC128214034 isoform X3 n=1 Tax=Mya arenaria TaxID=6604 RepID=UPI0022E18106|nr:uncharacterized protein LOC128214034 isoform X3 [Mya arenaria]